MFNRARPDKEIEGIIGRKKEKIDRQRGGGGRGKKED